MMTSMRLVLTLCACAMVGLVGCTSKGHDMHDTDYVFVYLKSGPTSGQGDKESRARMFEGHMGNIKALADEKKLLIAGPFNKPADASWRGILVLDTASMAEADEWCGRDPGVKAGEFIADKHAMRASSVLRRTLELEKQLQAEAKDAPPPDATSTKPSGPPPNIRAYVMVTAENFERAWEAVERSEWKDNVVWSGRFTGTPRGVIVLDSTDAANVRALLMDAGTCSVDGWWSTQALTKSRETLR